MPTPLMPIPGHVDPVPVPRDVTRAKMGGSTLSACRARRSPSFSPLLDSDARAAKLRETGVPLDLPSCVTDAMTDIAKTMRPWLSERFVIDRPSIVTAQASSDGTRKWLLRTADNHDFEMVFIPDADRGTLCVSSQVGCTLNCRFCHTGTMRLVRNLTPGEIVGQVMLARDALGEWPKGAGRWPGSTKTPKTIPKAHRPIPPTDACSPTSS
jgi:23S rRNA (adenine2503-C2)-methyltransferase